MPEEQNIGYNARARANSKNICEKYWLLSFNSVALQKKGCSGNSLIFECLCLFFCCIAARYGAPEEGRGGNKGGCLPPPFSEEKKAKLGSAQINSLTDHDVGPADFFSLLPVTTYAGNYRHANTHVKKAGLNFGKN